jgi:hypothetical protein
MDWKSSLQRPEEYILVVKVLWALVLSLWGQGLLPQFILVGPLLLWGSVTLALWL